MNGDPLAKLLDYVARQHPRSLRGIEEARAIAPDRFDTIGRMFLSWLVEAKGEDWIETAADAYVQFSTDVNLAQARYEADGRYENSSFAEVYANHYSRREAMDAYLWGVYLINFLWAHHLEVSLFYRDRFLDRFDGATDLVEIAPGHGGWGVWAMDVLPKARLTAFDVSPSSIDIARSISSAAGYGDRTTYQERDALDLSAIPAESADAVVCCFLAEHVEQPERLFAVVQHLLRPNRRAFLAAALTAAQVDHIHEFRRESELMRLCEDHGLRVLETLCASPRRSLPRARFLPRSMALIVQKRHNDIF